MTYFSVLVTTMHTIVTFFLSNNLARVFNNDLIRFERAVGTNPVAAVDCFAYLDTNVVLTASLCTFAEGLEGTIGAVIGADVAIAIIAFVEHETVMAIFIAATFGSTDTFRGFQSLGLLP